MAEGEKLLTDEELEAIEEVVASGNLGEGYNIGIEADSYDLTARENQPALDTEVLQQVNSRLQRHLRLSLLKVVLPLHEKGPSGSILISFPVLTPSRALRALSESL